MPSKKKKYNARFPAGRIKKIMQTDEEVGKVAQAVPVIISRTLELFVESLLKKSTQITQARSAKTLTPSHMKQCILSESRFDFLKDLVKNIPDASVQEDNENNMLLMFEETDRMKTDPKTEYESQDDEEAAAGASGIAAPATRTPVIHYAAPETSSASASCSKNDIGVLPPLVPITPNFYGSNVGGGDNLCIDEDYDN
ncbi:unnamed protein product [Brassicogethes aeneus]|uniref:Transcription factor CBF/NF-Y/archaeal histone domain-containing protein n=1 Tax=Brassicogethes aeneus TaxID=1431903 RepID=A0A9P0ARK7_BRAAE|nr:unnamed protein product [Brassicogethes aeneus]